MTFQCLFVDTFLNFRDILWQLFVNRQTLLLKVLFSYEHDDRILMHSNTFLLSGRRTIKAR